MVYWQTVQTHISRTEFSLLHKVCYIAIEKTTTEKYLQHPLIWEWVRPTDKGRKVCSV